MKILYVLQEFPYPLSDGVVVKVYNLISHMAEKHECHVLSFGSGELESRIDQFKERIPNIKIIGTFPKCVGMMLQFRRFVSFFSGEPLFLQQWKNNEFVSALADTLKNQEYDIVHLDALAMAQFIRLINVRPVVISTTDAVSSSYKELAKASQLFFQKRYISWASKRIAHFEKKTLPLFSKVHVISEKDKKYLDSFILGISVENIAHSVPDQVLEYEDASPCQSSEKFDLLIPCGALNTTVVVRGLMEFFSVVYPFIIKSFPDLSIHIIGRDASDDVYNKIKKIQNTKLSSWVDDYCGEHKKATVVVVPDWSGTGIKTRVLYAFALGKAVVASPAALYGIKIKEEFHCFKRKLDHTFADSIFFLLNNSRFREKMGKNAKDLIKNNYSKKATGYKWDMLYKKTINS
jgi:polysaccharide biosynthesis protein PslH